MGIKTAIAILNSVVFFMTTLQVSAQQHALHAVKEGETLHTIAREYKVTPYALLQANKELKKADDLKPHTLLIIPLESADTAYGNKEPEQKETPTTQKLLGFIQHKVRKRETLSGLARRYQITEEQLKRYNPKLYAEPLKKRMILQIPRFPQSISEDEQELDFEMYTVQPKETRWSIAHRYGITVDSLVALNPSLGADSDYLGIGQTLQLPRLKGGSLKEQNVVVFTSYTVPAKMTLYSLGKAYHISPDSIVKLNPEIVKKGGIQEGMVIRLPQKQNRTNAITTQNYIFYEVKPRQTLFSLTRILNTSSDTLFKLNPDLKKGLTAGMVLKLPKEKAKYLEVKNALVLDNVDLIDSIQVENKPTLVFMLPFRLDRIDFDDLEKTRSQIAARKDLNLSLGFYSGALVALDSIKNYGVSVAVRTYDTELNPEKARKICAKDSFSEVSAIIGPIAPDVLREVALATADKNIPVIAPVTSDSGLGYDHVFFSLPREEVLRKTMLSYLHKIHSGQNIIVIADSTHTAAHNTILTQFPTAKTAKLIEDRSLDLKHFLRQLSQGKENWVFLETDQSSMVASVTSILNSTSAAKTPIRMFTTSYSSAFETDALSNTHLSKIRFTYPSPYKTVNHNTFVSTYQKRFKGLRPNRYAVRGFDITFDILLKLAHKNNLFETSAMVGLTEYTGNRFNYFNSWTAGYYNKACYLMEYDALRIKEIPLHDF